MTVHVLPRRTRVKVCGMTRLEDIEASVAAGADALGFVFYEPSPRFVDLQRAAALMARIPPFVTSVGLFVNASEQAIRQHLQELPIDLLQFHGDETAAFCARFDRPWIKAVRMKPGVDLLQSASECAATSGACGVLADTFSDSYGGTGEAFDWSMLPSGLRLPLILSGGLTPLNVRQAVRMVRPWAVDVSSGVEGVVKGCKDPGKIEEFMRGVRDADAGLAV